MCGASQQIQMKNCDTLKITAWLKKKATIVSEVKAALLHLLRRRINGCGYH
jgi:hypothetical protein